MKDRKSRNAGALAVAAAIPSKEFESFTVKLPTRIAEFLKLAAADEGRTPEAFIAAAGAAEAAVSLGEGPGDQDDWREAGYLANPPREPIPGSPDADVIEDGGGVIIRGRTQKRIEAAAKRLGISRDDFVGLAATRYLSLLLPQS